MFFYFLRFFLLLLLNFFRGNTAAMLMVNILFNITKGKSHKIFSEDKIILYYADNLL